MNVITATTVASKGFYSMIKLSDMSYLVNNFIYSSTVANLLICGNTCTKIAVCNAFVFDDFNKNCTLFKQLASQLRQSVSSNVYVKN